MNRGAFNAFGRHSDPVNAAYNPLYVETNSNNLRNFNSELQNPSNEALSRNVETGFSITWVTRDAFLTTTVQSVAFGNGIFVAGANSGNLRTSTDAITWVTRTSGFGTTQINAVAFANGLWVAGGNFGQIRTSTNAITWVTQTSQFGVSQINSVAFGSGLWVAGGDNGAFRTSTPINFVEGVITTLVENTSITINSDRTLNSGTLSPWTVSLAGEVGGPDPTILSILYK